MSKASKNVKGKANAKQDKLKSKVASVAALVKKGEALCESAGFLHKHFQSEHFHASEPEGKGHWKMFLQSLAAPDDRTKIITCRVCCKLRSQLLAQNSAMHDLQQKPSPNESDKASLAIVVAQAVPACSSAAVSAEVPVLGPRIHKKGRPAKCEAFEARWRLEVFVQQHRSSVYRQTPSSWSKDATYHCVACGKDIKFKTHTCKQKLDKHEKGKTHIKGLKRLGLPMPEGYTDSADAAQSEEDDAEEAEEAGQELVCQQLVQQRVCSGLAPNDSSSPLHGLRSSVENFVLAGLPRTVYAEQESDPFADAIFDSTSQGIYVRSRVCKGCLEQGESVCAACKALGRRAKFREALGKKSYMIDLAIYAHRLHHAPEDQLQAFAQQIISRDYRVLNLAGADFEGIRALPSKLAQVAKIRSRFSNTPAWRFSPGLQAFVQQWLPKADLYHSCDLQASAHASLVAALGDGVATGKVRSLDLEVASKIATGALRGDALVDGLVTTFVQTLSASLLNKKRVNSSQWINEDALVDAIHTLGHGAEVQALLSRFRVNKQALPKLGFSGGEMPDTFVSLRDPNILKRTFQTVQSKLKASSERLHIVLDETTWSPSFQQARQFRDGLDMIVGGAWDPEGGEDWSCLLPEQHPLSTLPKEHMARTSLHFVTHRVDCTKYVFECCCLPTRTVIGSSETTLHLLSRFLDIVTEANAGKCPQSCAFDGCTSNAKIVRLFVGLLPEAEWKHLDFFRHCQVVYPELRFWPYGHVVCRGDLIIGFHGSYHLQKRLSLQFMSGGRKIRLGDMFVDLASELKEKLPARAFACSDVQSDRDAVMRLSPPFLSKSWSGIGQTSHGLIAALLASGTSASPGFSKAQMASNGLAAFYLLVLHVVYNESKKRPSAETLHITTLRNACALVSGIVTASMTGVEHRLVQERAIEEHFSRIKSPFRGHPTVRDGQQGLLCTHIKQSKLLEKETCESLSAPHTVQSREPLTPSLLQKIATRALATSIQYFCMLCVDESPDELHAKLRKWWTHRSESFFRSTLSADALDGDDQDFPEPEVEDEGDHQNATQAHNLGLIQAVEDRAKVAEQLHELLHEGERDASEEVLDLEGDTMDTAHAQDILPQESEDANDDDIPKTLEQIVSKAVRKSEYSKRAVGEEASREDGGVYSALKRARLLMGPSREFMRLVRLEERLLSKAVLELRAAPMNTWNLREAELAAARRAANVNGQRLARSAAWAAATQKLAASIAEQRSDNAPGLSSVAEFRPLDDANPQVIVFFREGMDHKPGLAVTLTVFRGAITKKGDKLVVRTSKAATSPLPCASTRRVHAVMLEQNAAGATWCASCASPVLLLDPVNCIFGQLTAESKATQTRMHVQLTQASLEDFNRMASARLPRVELQANGASSEDHEVSGQGQAAPEELTFNDRSFSRATLQTECERFMEALRGSYECKGWGFVKDGHVFLPGKKKEKWTDLLARVPSFFLDRLKQSKGFAFSKAVHLRLMELMPKGA